MNNRTHSPQLTVGLPCSECVDGILTAQHDQHSRWFIECGACRFRPATGHPSVAAAWSAYESVCTFRLTIPEDGHYMVNGELRRLRRGDVVTIKKS